MPSILRGFSAPVVLDFDYSDEQLLMLLAHDTDPFNRWEAGQRLALKRAVHFIRGQSSPLEVRVLDGAFIDAMRAVLRHPALDAAFKELVLTLPSETYIAEQLDVVDPAASARRARGHARTTGQRAGARLAMGLGDAP